MDQEKREKVKLFLNDKLKDCEYKIKSMKRKRKRVSIIYGTTIVISVTVSATTVAVSGMFALPLLPTAVITTLAAVGAISTALSTKFKLKSKKTELNNMISRLDRLKQQINYVMMCNGDLTESESSDIIKEFL